MLQNREINVLGARVKILTTPIQFFYVLRFLKNEFKKKVIDERRNPGAYMPLLVLEGLID
jgi:hypothetical protein